MQIVQQPELNRHIVWKDRWKFPLPLLVTYFLLLLELFIFNAWKHQQTLLDHLPRILGGSSLCMAILAVGMVSGIRFEGRKEKRTKRTLTLEEKGIVLQSVETKTVPWTGVSELRLEPIAEDAGLQKLTLQYARFRKNRRRFSWSMVLNQPDQVDALKAQLKDLHQTGVAVPTISQHVMPADKPGAKRANIRVSWAACCAVLLFFNSAPPLTAGLSINEERYPPSAQPTATGIAAFQPFRTLSGYFSSMHEFRRFLIVGGVSLALLGVLCYFYAISAKRKQALACSTPVAPPA